MKFSERYGRSLLREARAKRRDAFNVGLLIPTSGSMGLLGPCAYACARLASDLWNSDGGVDGREVRLTLLDSGETAEGLGTDVQAMIDSRDVDALVVLSNTAVCRQVAAAAGARVPLIYTPMFEGGGLPDWVHAIGETPDRQLLPAIDWVSERHRPRRWYLLGNDYSWPRRTHAIAIPFLKSSGASVVRERYVTIGERDYSEIIEDIVATRAEIVLMSLLAGDAVHMCRAFERAGLGGKVLRLSTCLEENAVLGVGQANSEGMFVAAGYFGALDSDVNAAFKERYRTRFGDRAPVLNSASQSVYEGFVHLHKQVHAEDRRALPGVRGGERQAYDARRNPIFLGEVEGLGIRPVRSLIGAPG